MSDMKHTPGPWRMRLTGLSEKARYQRGVELVVESADDLVCEMRGSRDLNEADARLIAAAPDLLEACKALREVLHHDCGASEGDHLMRHVAPASLQASAAIAKAGAE